MTEYVLLQLPESKIVKREIINVIFDIASKYDLYAGVSPFAEIIDRKDAEQIAREYGMTIEELYSEWLHEVPSISTILTNHLNVKTDALYEDDEN